MAQNENYEDYGEESGSQADSQNEDQWYQEGTDDGPMPNYPEEGLRASDVGRFGNQPIPVMQFCDNSECESCTNNIPCTAVYEGEYP